ncbi:antagonist of SinR [Salinibacillus kushneri]|uniref:Antagonist of SinR n=1 Tax=Salinibacillus kushneri TaxID=237682 RepID=A0A1I0GR15_9BACI|nr:anti-repressor SinI family protein [Salinibacillus kushneri]SET73536.1 antagonist of SinR [Salinibacillus kushneri]
MEMIHTQFTNLDPEWVELIMEALELGISEEEIKKFLANPTPC